MKYKLLILIIVFFTDFISSQQKGSSPLPIVHSKFVIASTYAVVVGISDYQDPTIPDLQFAHKDAEAFANYLRSPAGGLLNENHLKLLINSQATMAQFATALDWLIENVKEGDQAIIYFSGHGDVEKKTITQPGFLLCWDAPARVYMAGGAFALPMLQEVISTLSIQNKAKVLIITDACRSGTLAGSSVGGAQATAANLAKQYANEIKIMSCQPNEYSIEGQQWGGGRGAFSYHLIDALYGLADSNDDKWVTLQEVGRYLEDHVSNEVAPVSQIPLIIGNRNERLNNVDDELLNSIRSGKTNQMATLTSIESKGIEEEVFSQLDSSIRIIYQLFKNAIRDKNFFDLQHSVNDKSADSYYQILIKESKLERLHSTIKRNYAAALQDDAQQVLNKFLRADVSELNLSKKTKILKYRAYPKYLERAAELLGMQHYMYPTLQARRHFFEGYLLSLLNQNYNPELGEKALNEFRTALKFQPDLPHAYWLMSSVFAYNLNQSDSSEFYAIRAASLAPSWVLPYTNLAGFYTIKWSKFVRAKYYLEKANKIDSSSVALWNLWGLYYGYQSHFIEGEKQIKRAIHFDSNAVVLNNLGLIYNDSQRFMEAEEQLKKAIRLDSTYALSYVNLGLVYKNTNRLLEAEKQYKMAIIVDSTFAIAYNKLGQLYTDLSRFKDAEIQFNKAILLDSNFALTYNSLGLLYEKSNLLIEAEQAYKKAINRDSLLFIAYNNLGNLFLNSKRFLEVEQLFKRVIQLDSNYVNGYNNLGLVYVSTYRYEEAFKQYQKAIQLDSTYYGTYYNLACLFSLQNRFDISYDHLEQAIKRGFTDFDWLQQDSDLSSLREKKEQWDELMKNYFPQKIKN